MSSASGIAGALSPAETGRSIETLADALEPRLLDRIEAALRDRSSLPQRSLSPREAAERSGLHPRAIYRAVEAGELVATKPRGRWLIAETDYTAWAQRRRIRDLTRMATDTIAAATRELEDARRIQVERRGSRKVLLYRILPWSSGTDSGSYVLACRTDEGARVA